VPGAAPSVRVLVADDHALIRRLLHHAIDEHEGVEVVGETGDGDGAVRLARALAPDVVVLDLVMPGLGGLEAAAAIRDAVPGVAILIFSASDAARVTGDALAAGADRYVEKGAGFAAVAAAVHELGLERR
jgi:two-component system, NarL family, invasion response regulator UvrY